MEEAAREAGPSTGSCDGKLLKGGNTGITFENEEETSSLGKRQNKLWEEEPSHIVNNYHQRMDGYLKEPGL